MQQGDLVKLEISDLSNNGDGVGRIDGIVVFVPDTVTGDLVSVRIVRRKPNYAQGKLEKVIKPSPHRLRPRCIVADKCGGCQWQHIEAQYQQFAKRQHLIETLTRIGGFSAPSVGEILTANPLEYRNKATYPLKRAKTGTVQAGYYRRNSHQIVNLNQCPVQDPRLNPLLAEIKEDIQKQGWSIYQEESHRGKLRHLSLRIGRRTGEMFLTLVTTSANITGIKAQAELWLQRYPNLVGVALNYNSERTNVILGEHTEIVAGKAYLREIFADLEFNLRPDTFFQVNTEVAEALLNKVIERLNLQGTETLIDAYSGIGTFTLPLARKIKQAIAIEVHSASIEQGKQNAKINKIENVNWITGKVEAVLPQLEVSPELVLLDPPRKGCQDPVIDVLGKLAPREIVYISCQPATLARDLQRLCQTGLYQLTFVQPADFFPQTAHLECAAFLRHR